MLKYSFLFLFISIATLSIAQRQPIVPPNFNGLRGTIFNEKSDYYYPKLMQRFLANDTTMPRLPVRIFCMKRVGWIPAAR